MQISIEAEDYENLIHCYWIMMQECEIKAQHENDIILKKQVEGFYRLYSRLQEVELKPRWSKE